MINLVEKEWQEHQKIIQESEILKGQIAKIGELLCECLKKGGKILICGNGGSAADSQHFAAELSGKGGGKMNELCDHNLVVPSDDTARIQEMHILIIHTLCQIVDESF
ncbi:TPA: SIS domain-containing protein [Campylobacter coli]|nr:SIS domain-containing protein [Campylobacter coli]HED7860843.1 SIS domain-containing protein [Campylobacter coli]HED7868419.1 SIS domain-containing protein [Campylobacter coli]HED7870312.1 SIS domain-containing protein [Campylobacter coli]HED7949713.1 SIS domain-containing protein [Campylobacter coli]